MRRQHATPPEIPGLRFIETLGMGGFADVYRYEQLGRSVAVKVLTADLSYNTQQAFEAEANQMARLSNHPSIVSIYHAGAAPDGRSYLVMEVCQARTLDDRFKSRPYAPAKALEITVQIAGAVESAHRVGVLHRDIKPANILFTEFGRAALTDFGISVSTQEGEQGGGVGVSPAWAPPEQVTTGQPMGPYSDVYSLAATCWAMLAGRSPMIVPGGDNSTLALMARTRNGAIPPLRREDVPEALERVLRTALAKSPDQRYSSALEFGRALQAIQTTLHLPVTPIEVGEDDPDDGAWVDETTGGLGSTRISSFHVIDPDASAPVPAPRGFVSPPWPDAGHTVPRARDHVAGPAIASVVAEETVLGADAHHSVVPTSGKAAPTDQPPRSRRALPLVVGGMVVVALASILGWRLMGGSPSGTTVDVAVRESSEPADAIGDTIPAPRDLVLEVRGKRVEVTWRNPSPQKGDSFLYRIADPQSERPFEGPVESASVTLPKEPGRTCVEVVLRRSNGQVSSGTTECTR